nr:hypothetical protein [Tanacetum cinerariifolium]
DEEEEYEEEYIRTLDNYEFTDDKEEYEELYKDVNVRLRDVEHADIEINSMMNIDVLHEEPSIQTPPFLTIPVTVIPETSLAATSTIPPIIPPIIPSQHQRQLLHQQLN